jgi:transposase
VIAVMKSKDKRGYGETLDKAVERIKKSLPRKTYPQLWGPYNEAATAEKDEFLAILHELCSRVEEPPVRKTGRPPLPFRDMLFAVIFKVYTKSPSRQFISDLRIAHERGYVSKVCHFNTISNRLRDPELAPILKHLIVETSEPFEIIEEDFAVDSTGFTASSYLRWQDQRKWKKTLKQLEAEAAAGIVEESGTKKRRREHAWVKAHLAVGVRTNIITAIEIHEPNTSDTKVFHPLVTATNRNFKIREVSADKGYSDVKNVVLLNNMGIDGYIPFKKIHTGRRGGVWKEKFDFFNEHREEFERHYHKRSNVETVMHMMKAKFLNRVRSVRTPAMTNEVYCKAVAHNICCVIRASRHPELQGDLLGDLHLKSKARAA